MLTPAALAEDCGCCFSSGDQDQRAYMMQDDPVLEDFELSRRKVLGKGWTVCDDHPPVEIV